MFERFTPSARQVVTAAVEEAERRRDRHVGTEHLLLGLARSTDPLVAEALQAAGVSCEAARRGLEEADREALAAIGLDADPLPPPPAPIRPAGTGRRRRGGGHRPFTTGAKQVLEGSLREARELRDRRLGAEHLLLALAGGGQRDPAVGLLAHLGVDPVDLRLDLHRRVRRAA